MIYLLMSWDIKHVCEIVSINTMNRNRMIGFYVSPSDFARIVAVAKQEYCTVAAFCRKAVMRRVEEAEGATKRPRGGQGNPRLKGDV